MAASRIGIPHQAIDLRFSSDKDKHCRTVIAHRHPTAVIYDDVTTVDHELCPSVDVFTSGFPCQPFSREGLKLGTKDDRGKIGKDVIKYIQRQKPKTFILENVPTICRGDHKKFFDSLIQSLKKVKDNGTQCYFVDHKVLNTAEHGIPQSRKRVYIVGIKKKNLVTEFEWPRTLPFKNPADFLDPIDKKLLSEPDWPTSARRLQVLLTACGMLNDVMLNDVSLKRDLQSCW